MKWRFRIYRTGLALAALNLLLTFLVYREHFEGSWGGFVLFCLDFPISLLSFLPVGWNQWLFFFIVGPAWWYFVGMLIVVVFESRQSGQKDPKIRGHENSGTDHG